LLVSSVLITIKCGRAGAAVRSGSFGALQVALCLGGAGIGLANVGRQTAMLQRTPAHARGRATALCVTLAASWWRAADDANAWESI
jgi:hypothetical protein